MPDRPASMGLQAARVLLVLGAIALGAFCVRTANLAGALASLAVLGGASYALVQGKALRPEDLERLRWRVRGRLIGIGLGLAALVVASVVAAVVDG